MYNYMERLWYQRMEQWQLEGDQLSESFVASAAKESIKSMNTSEGIKSSAMRLDPDDILIGFNGSFADVKKAFAKQTAAGKK